MDFGGGWSAQIVLSQNNEVIIMLIDGVRDYDRIYELMFESDYSEIIKIMTGEAPNGYTGHDDVDFHDIPHMWGNGMALMVIGEVVSVDKDGAIITGNIIF